MSLVVERRAAPPRSPLVSRRRSAPPHCTLAVIVGAPVSVNVHVFALFPPLEQAPDQMASRPFVTLSVICVLVANDADPLLPTATLIPAGLDVTRSRCGPSPSPSTLRSSSAAAARARRAE